MVGYKVLITTSGIGSRLGELTNFTNKSLVRVGKKPAISYIIESYVHDVEFVVTCGYFGEQVKNFLKLAYPTRKITFVDVDNFSGEGSSLGYSMLKAKEHLNCPFIFHAADTIILERIPEPDCNWIGYNKKENYSQYRTVDILTPKILDKGNFGSDLAYVGLCGIKDHDLFWSSLEQSYRKDPNDSTLSDCHAINKIIDKKWKTIKFDKWLDIGNVSELNNARNLIHDKFHILDKVDESIFIFEDFVIKFFYDNKICQNRVTRAKELQGLVPEILDSSENFYKYRLVNGNLLANVVDEVSFKRLFDWSLENLWIEKDDTPDFKSKVKNFYYDKTIKRLELFYDRNLMEDESTLINGVDTPKLIDMINTIDFDWLCDVKPFQFHGDFILDNIIMDDFDNFVLIDWRQDFSGDLKNGDIYYDLSKLNHNLVFNHEIINAGNFFVTVSGNVVKYDLHRSDNLTNCRELFHKLLQQNGFDLKRVKILTSLIWLNMSPLHETYMSRLLYYMGKLNLYRAIHD